MVEKEITAAINVIIERATSKRIQSVLEAQSGPQDPKPNVLLDFNINQVCGQLPKKKGRPKGQSHRPWSVEDRQRLAVLMKEGLGIDDIAADLNRTVSAVVQQWRKQRGDELDVPKTSDEHQNQGRLRGSRSRSQR